MRTIPTFLILASLCMCASPASQTQQPAPTPDASVDPSYCLKYCQAQASDGTLKGTLQDCQRSCCTRVPAGCEEQDGGGGDAGPVDATVTDSGTDAKGSPEAGGDGSACAAPCGSACCTASQACGTDATGQPACLATCNTRADCPSTTCCAPATNAAGDPVGPYYICQPDDGKAYHCCQGFFTSCDSAYCCVTDGAGNKFCATPCTSNAPCGAAHCEGFTFGTLSTTCSGPTACGP